MPDAMKTAEFWLKATKQVGFPVVVAAMLLYMGDKHVGRLLDAHEQFLINLSQVSQQTLQVQRELVEAQREMHQITADNNLILRRLNEQKEDSGGGL